MPMSTVVRCVIMLAGVVSTSMAQIRAPRSYNVDWNRGHLESYTTYIAPGDAVTWTWNNPPLNGVPGTNVVSLDQYRDPLLNNRDPWNLFASDGEATQLVGIFTVVFSNDPNAQLPSGNIQADTYATTITNNQGLTEYAEAVTNVTGIFADSMFDRERYVLLCGTTTDISTGEKCRLDYRSGANLCSSISDVNPAITFCSSSQDIVAPSTVVVEEICQDGFYSTTCDDPTAPRGTCQPWQTVQSGFYQATPGTACLDRVVLPCTLCNCPTQFEAQTCQQGGDVSVNRICRTATQCTFPGPDPRTVTDLDPLSGSQTGCSAIDRVCGCCNATCPNTATFPVGGYFDVASSSCLPISQCIGGFIGQPATASSDVECRLCSGESCYSLKEDYLVDIAVIIDDSGSVTDIPGYTVSYMSEAVELMFHRLNASGNVGRTMAIRTTVPNATLFDFNDQLTLEERLELLPSGRVSNRYQGFMGQSFETIARSFEQQQLLRSTVVLVLFDGNFGESPVEDVVELNRAVNTISTLSGMRARQQDFSLGNGILGWTMACTPGCAGGIFMFEKYVSRAVDNGFSWVIQENALTGSRTRYLLATNVAYQYTVYAFDLATGDTGQFDLGTAFWDGVVLTRTQGVLTEIYTPDPGTTTAITGAQDRFRIGFVSFEQELPAPTINNLISNDVRDPLTATAGCQQCFDRFRTDFVSIETGKRYDLLSLDTIFARLFSDDVTQTFGVCGDSACGPFDFETNICDASSDQVCTAKTYCDPVFEYESIPATASTDRVCSSANPCLEGTYEDTPLTFSADRICLILPNCTDLGGTCTSYGGGCGDTLFDEYQSTVPTATSDRGCTVYSQCDGRYIENRQSRFQYASILPTATSDRECSECSYSAAIDPVDFVFALDVSGSIEDPLYGGNPGNFDIIRRFVSNMIQQRPVANSAWTDSIDLQGAAGTKFAAIQFSDAAEVQWGFNDFGYVIDDLLQAVQNNITYEAGETALDEAIRLFIDVLLNPSPQSISETGFRNFSVPVVFVVVTDGSPSNETLTRQQLDRFISDSRLANAISDGKLILYPVAIGPINSNAVTRVRELFDFRDRVPVDRRDSVVVPSIYDLVETADSVVALESTTLQDSIIARMNDDLTSVAPRCPSNQYISTACNDTSDVVCSDLTVCYLGLQYVSKHPTATSDRECGLISTCSGSYFEAAPPADCYGYLTEGRTLADGVVAFCSDRDCQPVSICDPCTEYQTIDFTPTTDRVCEPLTTCPNEGFYIQTSHSRTTDRFCDVCSPPCGQGLYESVPCSVGTCLGNGTTINSSDRECEQITNCQQDSFASVTATSTSDAVCTPLSTCDGADEFIDIAATPTSDNICGFSPECDVLNYFENAPLTRTSERICRLRTSCNTNSQFEVDAGSIVSDRVCANITICNLRQYEASPPTPTTDRQCLSITGDGLSCPSSQWRASPATPTTDIDCRDPLICRSFNQYIGIEFSATSDRTCEDITDCDEDSFETNSPTATSDRQCSMCTVCGGVADQRSTPGELLDGFGWNVVSESYSQNLSRFGSGDVIFVVDQRHSLSEQIALIRGLVDKTPLISDIGTHFALISFGEFGAQLEFGFQRSRGETEVEIDAFTTRRPPTPNGVPSPGPISDAYRVVNALLDPNGNVTGFDMSSVRYRGYGQRPIPTPIIFLIGEISTTSEVVFGGLASAIAEYSSLLSANGWPSGQSEVIRKHVVVFRPNISDLVPLAIARDTGQYFKLSGPTELLDSVNEEEILFSYCREICPYGWFQSQQCTYNADRICSIGTVCQIGQYESQPLTLTSDRVCQPIATCNTDPNNALPLEFEASGPTPTSNRQCINVTHCDICSPAQAFNEQLQGFDTCEFEVSPATEFSDAVCSSLTRCTDREFQSAAPTASSDRGCLAIGPCTIDEFEDPSFTLSDDGCRNLTVCNDNQYERFAPQLRADRVCVDLTDCRPYEFEVIAGTSTSDRVCERCSRCFGEPMDFYFVLSRSNSIDFGPAGASGMYQTLRDTIEYLVMQAPVDDVTRQNTQTRVNLLIYPGRNLQPFELLEYNLENIVPSLYNISMSANATAWIDPTPATERLNQILTNLSLPLNPTRVYFLSDGDFSTADAQLMFGLKTDFPQVSIDVVTIGESVQRQPQLLEFWEQVSSTNSVHQITSSASTQSVINELLDDMCSPCGPNSYEVHPCSSTPAPREYTVTECPLLMDEVSVDSCTTIAGFGLCINPDAFTICNRTCSFALNIQQECQLSTTPAPTQAPTPAPTLLCPQPPRDTISTSSCRSLAQLGACNDSGVFAVCEALCTDFLNLPTPPCAPAAGEWFPTLTSNKVCAPLTVCDLAPAEFEAASPTITTDRICSFSSVCDFSQFEVMAPTASTDRECQDLSPVCNGSFWEVVSPSATSDRLCAPFTICNSNEYEIQPGTAFSDRDCEVLSELCNTTDSYECIQPTATTDRSCCDLTVCNPEEDYISELSSYTSDRVCSRQNICDLDSQYISQLAGPLSDQVCTNLTECTSGEFVFENHTDTSDRQCAAVTNCPDNFYISEASTEFSDTVCSPITICDITLEFERVPPTNVSDRACEPITVCDVNQYSVSLPTITSDRVCTNTTACNDTQFASIQATTTSDRVCTPCTTCNSSSYTAVACNTLFNTICEPLQVCDVQQYERVPPTLTSNRLCENATICRSGQYVLVPLTLTADRACRFPSVSYCNCSRQFEVVAPSPTTDAVCEEYTQCDLTPESEFEAVAPTCTSDRVCSACSSRPNGECSGHDSRIAVLLDSGDSIELAGFGGVTGTYDMFKDAALGFLDHFDIGEAATRVSVISFGTSVTSEFGLSPTILSPINISSEIGNLIYAPRGVSNLAAAASSAANTLFDADSSSSMSPGSTVVVVYFTNIFDSISVSSSQRNNAEIQLTALHIRGVIQFLWWDNNFYQLEVTGAGISRVPVSKSRIQELTCPSRCSKNRFLSSECTAVSDSICTPVSVCEPTVEFESHAPTVSSDRVCTLLTPCNFATQYVSSLETSTSDRRCTALRICTGDEYESVLATDTSDRQCANRTTCLAVNQYEHVSPTPTTDRICRFYDSPECISSQYEAVARTATTDRLCVDIRTCLAGQIENMAPTATTDRLCTDYDSAFRAVDGFCASSRTGRTTYQLDNATLLECEVFCNNTDGCQSFVRGVNGAESSLITAPCIILTETDRCCRSVISHSNWTSWISPHCSAECSLPYPTPLIVPSTPMSYNQLHLSPPASRSLTLRPVLEYEEINDEYCTLSTTFSFPDRYLDNFTDAEFVFDTCRQSCDSNNTCSAFHMGSQFNPVSQRFNALCGFGETRCLDVSGRGSSSGSSLNFTTYLKPGAQSACSGVLCSAPPQCFETTQCNGGSCIANSVADTTVCDDDLALTPASACRAGICEGRCPSTMFIVGAPIADLSTPIGLSIPAIENVYCAVISPECCSSEYQERLPTTTSDRVCTPLTVCNSSEWSCVSPTATSDRSCCPVTCCECQGLVNVLASNGTTDAQCELERICSVLEYEFHPLEFGVSNRECHLLTVCDEYFQFESHAPTTTSDRICSNISTCDGEHPLYVMVNATSTTDRVCAEYEPCSETFWEASETPLISNQPVGNVSLYSAPRYCQSCTRSCTPNSAMDLIFMVDESGSIDLPFAGGVTGDFQRELALFGRVVNSVESISLDTTRVAVVSYSREAEVDFDFDDYNSKAQVINALSSLQYSGLNTQLGEALQTVRRQLLVQGTGFRGFAAPVVVVLVVDGQLNGESDATLASEVNDWIGLSLTATLLGQSFTTWVYVNQPSDGSSVSSRDQAIFEAIAGDPSRVIALQGFATAQTPEFLDGEWLGETCLPGCDYTVTYESVLCTPTTDRVCTPLSNCIPPNFFEGFSPTRSSDRQCIQSSACTSNEYEAFPPGRNFDRLCQPLTNCDMESQFLLRESTPTTDRICGERTACSQGEYQANPPTATSARVCSNISTCNQNNEYISAPATATTDTICIHFTVCGANTYECITPTFELDRGCCTCRTCSDQQYGTGCSNGTDNRQCLPLTECTNDEFESLPSTVSSDRTCTTIRGSCSDTEVEVRSATATTDRVCEDVELCCSDEYEEFPATQFSQPVCVSISNCSPYEFQLSAATSTSDSVCQPLTFCNIADEFEFTAPTATSDRICNRFTQCNSNEIVQIPASSTSDRTCASTQCDLSNNFCSGLDLCPDLNTTACSCTPLTQCPSGAFEAQSASIRLDRVCLPVTLCEEEIQIEHTPPTATSDRVCCSVNTSAGSSALSIFDTPIAHVGSTPETITSRTSIASAEACADICAGISTCAGFSHSNQFDVCLIFGESAAASLRPMSAGSQFEDFFYFHRISSGPVSCIPGTDTQRNIQTAQIVPNLGPDRASMLTGSFAMDNLGKTDAFSVEYDCLTFQDCHDSCSLRGQLCTGFEFSSSLSICILLNTYLPGVPTMRSDFIHFTQRQFSFNHPSVLHDLTLYGNVQWVPLMGKPSVVIDGSDGSFGEISSAKSSTGSFGVDLEVMIVPFSTISYMSLISKYVMNEEIFRAGIDFTNRSNLILRVVVQEFRNPDTSNFEYILPENFADGTFNNISILVYGPILTVSINGINIGEDILDATYDDNDGVIRIGEGLSGALSRVSVSKSSPAVVPPASSLMGTSRDNCSRFPSFLTMPSNETDFMTSDIDSVSQTFSIALSIMMKSGTSGYLFAKANPSGSLRRFALYVPKVGRVRMYYTPSGSSTHRVTYFGVTINDGREHQVVMSVSGASAKLRVDDTSSIAVLAGPIDDCSPGPSCILALGRRPSRFGSGFRMTGTINEFLLNPIAAYASYPVTGRYGIVDLLTADVNSTDTGNVLAAQDGSLIFDGDSRRDLAFVPSSWRNFRIDIEFSHGSSRNGYLVANTDLSGAKRYLALYSSVSGKYIWLFYTANGATSSVRFTHNIDLSSNSIYSLGLTVYGSSATLELDNYVETIQLSGNMEVCANVTDCAFSLGQREPGVFGFAGSIRRLHLRY